MVSLGVSAKNSIGFGVHVIKHHQLYGSFSKFVHISSTSFMMQVGLVFPPSKAIE